MTKETKTEIVKLIKGYELVIKKTEEADLFNTLNKDFPSLVNAANKAEVMLIIKEEIK